MLLLGTYQQKYGLKNISDLISRWAPNNENNTNSYINSVSNSMNLSPQAVINIKDKATLISLVNTIIFYENGQQPYNDSAFDKAYSLILLILLYFFIFVSVDYLMKIIIGS